MEDNERQSYNQEDQDDFGLPEVEYHPLDRDEEEMPSEFEQSHYYQEDEEESNTSKGLLIFGIITLVVIACLSVYLFLFGGLAQVSSWFEDEPAPVTYVEPEPEPEPEPEIVETESVSEVNPLAPYSEISTISEPTGRSYIIIGSFVDEDLSMDFGNKMVEQGIGVRIISPTNRAPLMHRVAVADFAAFDEAMGMVEQFRNNYGENTWVLKY